MAVVRRLARTRNVGLVGTVHEVLVEGYAKRGGLLQTRSRTNKVVLVEGPESWIGTYTRCVSPGPLARRSPDGRWNGSWPPG